MQDFYSEEPIKETTATEEGYASTESSFDFSEYVRKNRAFGEAQKKKLYKTMNAAPAPISEELKKAVIAANEQCEKWRAEHKPGGSTPPKLQMPKLQEPYLQKMIQEKEFPKITLPPSPSCG